MGSSEVAGVAAERRFSGISERRSGEGGVVSGFQVRGAGEESVFVLCESFYFVVRAFFYVSRWAENIACGAAPDAI